MFYYFTTTEKAKVIRQVGFAAYLVKRPWPNIEQAKGVKIQLFCKAKRERQLTPRSANECETTPPLLIVAKNNRPTKRHAMFFLNLGL